VQEQETSKAQARTEQLKKEILRTKEVQDAQRQKELVVIANQREVEVAKQVAERETIEQRKLQDLAVIQKVATALPDSAGLAPARVPSVRLPACSSCVVPCVVAAPADDLMYRPSRSSRAA